MAIRTMRLEKDEILRKKSREVGVDYFVAKNRLFKLALQEAGFDVDFGTDLKGTTAFALSMPPSARWSGKFSTACWWSKSGKTLPRA